MGARAATSNRRANARATLLAVAVVLVAAVLDLALVFSSPLEAATPTASDVQATLTAGSIDVTNLVFVDTVNVTTEAGPISTLLFSTDAATIHGMSLALPCFPVPNLGGLTAGIATGASDLTTASAGLTFYATDVQASVAGNPIHFSVSDPSFPPPPTGTTLLASGTLTSPTIVFALSTAPSLTVSGSTTTATFCTPSGAGGSGFLAPKTKSPTFAPPTAAVPSSGATRSPEPVVKPSPTTSSATPEPSPYVTPAPAPAPSPTQSDPSPSPSPTDTVSPDPSPSPSV
jgi:hypothetical protein